MAQVAEEKRIRKEIARDFHDELGNQAARLINMISLLKLKGLIQKENYEQLSIFAQNILDGAKDFVWALDPKNDDLYHAVIHLKDFGERLFLEKEITFRYFGEVKEGTSLPTGFSRQINLIFKEAMTNAFKHSKATDVDFRIEKHKREVFIILTDNGRGVAKEIVNNSRSGFENMRFRAKKIGGEIEFQSSSYGTTIQLKLRL